MIPTIPEKFETNLEQVAFSIGEKQSGFIISMLRNNIYSNPLLNSMKETLSNALDEHSKYQIIKPIDICLPNSFSKSLTIRDYADGMSKDFMLNEYTHVGESTKSHNNDALGGLGIGRMSPLAYADMYLITSITIDHWDNVKRKREYVVSKDNHKVFCSILLEDETDEDTGVLVSFDIKDKDHKVISEYVYENIKYIYDVSISINGVLYEPEKPTHTYKSFKVFSNRYGSSLIGLIGGLPNSIKIYDYNDEISKTIIQFINNRTTNSNCIVFDIEIGQVDQSADKNIQLSTRTKQYIGQKFSQIYTDFVEFINNEISTVTNWCNIVNFMHKFNISCHNNTSDYMWKDKSISLDSWLRDIYSYKSVTNKKDGSIGYRCKPYLSTNYGEPYNSKNTYYYNDLTYIPRTDVLSKSGIGDLDHIVIVNNINNTYYDLPLLSSFLPKHITVKTKNVNTKVSLNKKCYRMSKHHEELGRLVNIDLDKKVYFITRAFYDSYVGVILRDKLFNYANCDIYIVNDAAYVKDHWIDLHKEFRDMFADINANTYHNYNIVSGGRSFYSSIVNKLLFIDENPTHIISKVFTTMRVFINNYLKHYSLIHLLVSKGIIELKEPPTYCIKQACDDIELIYPMINGGRYITTISEELVLLYIKQVDTYNQH